MQLSTTFIPSRNSVYLLQCSAVDIQTDSFTIQSVPDSLPAVGQYHPRLTHFWLFFCWNGRVNGKYVLHFRVGEDYEIIITKHVDFSKYCLTCWIGALHSAVWFKVPLQINFWSCIFWQKRSAKSWKLSIFLLISYLFSTTSLFILPVSPNFIIFNTILKCNWCFC